MVVKLETIANAFEEITEIWQQYLNKETGEIVSLCEDASIYQDLELEEEIEFSDKYVRLPSQYDIHEYSIMRKFAEMQSPIIKGKLLEVLSNKKPYRNFKDKINYLGISQNYYSFRTETFRKLAEEWCIENQIIL
ncbi:MAG: UPF0158 family protein [Clostridia bacterium]